MVGTVLGSPATTPIRLFLGNALRITNGTLVVGYGFENPRKGNGITKGTSKL